MGIPNNRNALEHDESSLPICLPEGTEPNQFDDSWNFSPLQVFLLELKAGSNTQTRKYLFVLAGKM